jgi:predicted ATP-dependent serine protease
MLAEALRRCRSGRGGVVLISGEAGIGKTRLVDEVFREWDGGCRRAGHRESAAERLTSAYRTAKRLGAKHNLPRASCAVQLWSLTALPGQPFPCT